MCDADKCLRVVRPAAFHHEVLPGATITVRCQEPLPTKAVEFACALKNGASIHVTHRRDQIRSQWGAVVSGHCGRSRGTCALNGAVRHEGGAVVALDISGSNETRPPALCYAGGPQS
jgi:hypothetical protein